MDSLVQSGTRNYYTRSISMGDSVRIPSWRIDIPFICDSVGLLPMERNKAIEWLQILGLSACKRIWLVL